MSAVEEELLTQQHRNTSLLNATTLLPHPTTVCRHLADATSQQRTELGIELRSVLTQTCVGVTSDMWTDNYKKRAYLTITGNWITEQWIMSSRVLCTEEFNPSLRKTRGQH
ncbi:hypothetical protein LSH36_744g01012 [Paralvinella palmiformis]|uniref:Transposase n=1 Tax=Paralvinella palmiformis TaxID=53620 RepID=A0AAD9J1X8_9ANNE|nr:hypothetical protein LSH36_744g01012 [Paralvinella palmiformis]